MTQDHAVDGAFSPDRGDRAGDGLSRQEQRQVDEREALGSRVVHEIIRRSGQDELDRPVWSLWWSGIAAGFGLGTSILGEALLTSVLPDTPWRPAVAAVGYSLGFLIVVLGRLELFTESTLLAVIPVVSRPSLPNLARLARLWTIVLVANITGTLVIAFLVQEGWIGFHETLPVMLDVARNSLDQGPMETLRGGIPAGFLLAAVAWSMPTGRGQEFWITLFFTYFIGLGHFSHVVAGSEEAWLLVLHGDRSLGWAIGGFLLPALVGNVLGGSGLFALVAHAQVSDEIRKQSPSDMPPDRGTGR